LERSKQSEKHYLEDVGKLLCLLASAQTKVITCTFFLEYMWAKLLIVLLMIYHF